MKPLHRILLPLLLLALGIASFAQSNNKLALAIGDNAPALKVGGWVKGGPIDSFEPGKIYVVEFWATWCGPCKVSIPHLTELQKKFGDKATFIGVSSFENDWSKVAPFVQSEGDQMDYNVAVDQLTNPTDREGFMAKNWMIAAHQNGIPTAFIVDKDGKIAWIGHPMNLESPLSQVIEGTWDRDQAAKQFAQQMEKQEQAQNSPANKVMRQYAMDMRASNYDAAIKDIDKLQKVAPSARVQADVLRLQTYQKANEPKEWLSQASGMVKNAKTEQDAFNLNEIAWTIADPKGAFISPRDLKLAQRAAERAVDITHRKVAAFIDTLAWCYYWRGDKKQAITLEQEAMSKLAPGDNKDDYTTSMNTFQS